MCLLLVLKRTLHCRHTSQRNCFLQPYHDHGKKAIIVSQYYSTDVALFSKRSPNATSPHLQAKVFRLACNAFAFSRPLGREGLLLGLLLSVDRGTARATRGKQVSLNSLVVGAKDLGVSLRLVKLTADVRRNKLVYLYGYRPRGDLCSMSLGVELEILPSSTRECLELDSQQRHSEAATRLAAIKAQELVWTGFRRERDDARAHGEALRTHNPAIEAGLRAARRACRSADVAHRKAGEEGHTVERQAKRESNVIAGRKPSPQGKAI